MTRRILWLRDAENDVAEIANWYDEQRTGLAAEFLDAVEQVVTRVARWPAYGLLVGARTRRVLVPSFPYLVLFVSHEEHVEVTAVCHFARHPRRWSDRVNELSPEYAAA